MGGDRELVLGCLMAVRLAAGAVGPNALPHAVRAERSAAARTWLGALGVPAAARAALTKLVDAAADDDLDLLGRAVERVATLCAPTLDGASRLELDRLAAAIAGQSRPDDAEP